MAATAKMAGILRKIFAFMACLQDSSQTVQGIHLKFSGMFLDMIIEN